MALQVRGTYMVNPSDPVSGAAQDPDNNYEITSWGDDPPGAVQIIQLGMYLSANTVYF